MPHSRTTRPASVQHGQRCGALQNNTTGCNNTAFGNSALFGNTTGCSNTGLGVNANVAAGNLNNATAIGANAVVDASNHVRVGDTNVTQIGGQVAWSNLSDRREKKDIRALSLGLEFVMALRPVEYRMRNGNERIDFGFIAQEVETLVGTNYNVLGIGGTAERKLSLRYTDFVAPMVKAIQEQQALIDAQRAQIASPAGTDAGQEREVHRTADRECARGGRAETRSRGPDGAHGARASGRRSALNRSRMATAM